MWFKYTVYSLCVALCLGAPQGSEPGSEDGSSSPIPIIAQDDTVEDNGTRHFSYETGNGIKVEESSYTKKVPHLAARVGGAPGADDDKEEDEVLVLTGSFSYTAPDGTLISLRYIADENGFQPIGEHLPTSPPIPEAILKSLQNLPPDNEIEDGAPAQGDK